MTAVATGSLRGGDATVFYPVMRFVTAREQEVRFQVREGSQDPSRYGVVTRSGVLYDPANPRNARLDTWVSRRGDSLTMVAIGLGLVVLGAVGLWLLRSSGRTAGRAAQQNRPAQDAEGRAAGGHHATSIITGAKIVGVASGRDLCPRAHDGACRSDIVGRVVLPAPRPTAFSCRRQRPCPPRALAGVTGGHQRSTRR